MSRANLRGAARAALATAAAGVLLLGAAPASAQMPRAKVAQGALLGKTEAGVAVYLGVPFAAPPVGANRWRPPAKPASWKGERKADRFSASCQQAVSPSGHGPWTAEYMIQNETSEDCLTLNVWTPAKAPGEKLPVLFWIYGGGFTSGGSSVAVYNGAHLASKGIVVVSANYRVGVYGFLAHPELTAESPARASGNYGLLDMVAALQWVRDNVASFGGDPTRVTIAGQSAGAASVHHLISSPLAKGLFRQAIAQSGSGMGLPVPDHAAAEAIGQNLSGVGGSALTLAQLRQLSAAELDARVSQLGIRFSPVVDGLVLPNPGTVGWNTNDTPLLTGMTANEGTGFNADYDKVTLVSFRTQLDSVYGKLASEVMSLYPAVDDKHAWASSDALARDRGLASMFFWARARLPHTEHPVYAYLWTHIEPGPESARYLSFHSSEIPYVFGTLDTAKRPFTDGDRKLAAQSSAYWVNFVKTGNPNGDGLPRWPLLTRADRQILELGEATRPRTLLDDSKLDLFDRYVKSGGSLSLF